MSRSFINIASVYFSHFLVIILLFHSIQPVQSIALSSLCANFGHSCFGGNWGKRESSPDILQSNDGDEGTISPVHDETFLTNYLLDQIRLNLFRQRLRQLLELE